MPIREMEGCLEFVQVSAWNPGICKSQRILKYDLQSRAWAIRVKPRTGEPCSPVLRSGISHQSVPRDPICWQPGSPAGANAQKPPPGSPLPWANPSSKELSFTSCLSGSHCLTSWEAECWGSHAMLVIHSPPPFFSKIVCLFVFERMSC